MMRFLRTGTTTADYGSLAALLNEGLDEVLSILLEHAVDLVKYGVNISVAGRRRDAGGVFYRLVPALTPGVDWLAL